jgi:allantoinase
MIRSVRIPTRGPGLWDVAIREGALVALGKNLRQRAGEEISGSGAILLPGFVDTHVHLNEPGRTSWEGIATGTRALAAGGATSFLDMPLNSSPPCTTAEALEEKRALMQKKSLLDFGLWGGLVPGNAGKISQLARAGARAIKAFLCPSGLDEFPASDEKTLLAGARACARAGLLLGVHAEHPKVLEAAAEEIAHLEVNQIRRFLLSRPVEVEERAIELCLQVAEMTGCQCHIVHVSAPRGLQRIRQAARRGVRITAETCPHYLLLDPSLLEKIGGRAKCAPPLREKSVRQALWQALQRGDIQTIGSDHSPALPSMKSRGSFVRQWGGISGAQHGSALFLAAARERRIPWPDLTDVLSRNPARIFRLARKGQLVPGADADFVLWEKIPPRRITAEELLTRHPLSPYIGEALNWQPSMTFVRGRKVWSAQEGCARPGWAREIETYQP